MAVVIEDGMLDLPPHLIDPMMGPGWLLPREVRRRRRQWSRCKDRDRWYDEIKAGLHDCAHCGVKSVWVGGTGYLVVDHIVPLSRGGTNNDVNLQVLCDPCNSSKGAQLP